MSGIVEFIKARIDEDEQAAREAIEPKNMHPYADARLPAMTPADVPDGVRGYLGGAWGEHFARHDPARVLAEVAAKRLILRACVADEASGMQYTGSLVAPDVLSLLAMPYADHPDFDPAWRLYETTEEQT